MKIGYTLSLALVAGLLIFSCSKEKNTPINAANTTNLAGVSGSSKTWVLTSFQGSRNGGAVQTFSILDCQGDNVFKFTNDAAQSYIVTEGSLKCNSSDSTVLESGNWAFSNDGKSLLIDGTWFTSVDNLNNGTFAFTIVGESVNIVELKSTSLKVSFTLHFNGNTDVYTLAFVPKT